MQDYLEEYFGHQRQRGRRSDNPDAVQFGYNDRILQVQRNAGLVSRGNVGARRMEGSHTGLPSGMSHYQRRKRRTNLEAFSLNSK